MLLAEPLQQVGLSVVSYSGAGPPVSQEEQLTVNGVDGVVVDPPEELRVAEEGDGEGVEQQLQHVDHQAGHQKGEKEKDMQQTKLFPPHGDHRTSAVPVRTTSATGAGLSDYQHGTTRSDKKLKERVIKSH